MAAKRMTCLKYVILVSSTQRDFESKETTMVKLLMKWDIKSGHEQPYFEFVMQDFAPGLMRLGLQPTEAWYTVYGKGPQILTGAVTDDLETMRQILAGAEWRGLRERLLEYVANFSYKVVQASGRFQL